MWARAVLLALALLVAARPAAPALPFLRGVCWEAAGRVDGAALDPLVRDHAGWISQTPFGWERDPGKPPIVLATGHHEAFWGESDEGIAETTRMAHARGIRVLLAPHVWTHGGWTGVIAMKSEEDWARWFASYRTFILHYADLARACGIEALAVGMELGGTTGREREWREVIAEVRRHYGGRLVYGANWAEDLGHVRFWDALDWIGVQAYYPLSDRREPGVAELTAAWRKPLADLESISRRWGKPVVFTEVGYHSLDTAASRPWVWDLEGSCSPVTQARCYEALFRALEGAPAVRGVFVWKWNPYYAQSGGPDDTEYTPQRKPAEEVLRRAFTRIERTGE